MVKTTDFLLFLKLEVVVGMLRNGIRKIKQSYLFISRQKLFEAISSKVVYNQGINCSQSHFPKVCKMTKNVLHH